MFVLKNAWAGMLHRLPRTLLLVLTAVAVSFGSVIGLSILDADHTANTTTYSKLQPAAVFRVDRERVTKANGGDASKIDWTKYHLSWNQYSEYVQKAGTQLADAYYGETAALSKIDGKKLVGEDAELTLTGFSNEAASQGGINGAYQLVSGKKLAYDETGANQALIPQALAKQNNLKVGDKIKLFSDKKSDKGTELTIAGIYKNTTDVDAATTGMDPDNAIYTSFYTLSMSGRSAASADESSTTNLLDVSMVLESPSDYDKFVKAVRKAGLSKDYAISSPTIDAFHAKNAPLSDLAGKAKIVVIALAIAGTVLGLLLLAWGLASRTEEIGFLTFVGVGGGRIGWQLALEAIFPTLAGWIVGTVAGVLACKPVVGALASGVSATAGSGIIWKLIWVGLGVLVAIAVICWARVLATTSKTLLAARKEA